MLTQVDAGNVVRSLTTLTQVDATGVVRSLQSVYQNDASNTPRLIFSSGGGTGPGGSITATPDSVSGNGFYRGPIRVVTDNATVNNAPSDTYLWHTSAGWDAIGPEGQNTSFRSPAVGPGASATGTAYCSVTNSAGVTVVTNTIALSAINNYEM